MSIVPVSIIEQRLATASTPQETKQIEEVSAAARAYYYEQGNYEAMVEATRLYLLARRKTTELISGERNIDVTLAEYGFTRMQWHRRMNELKIEQDMIDAYFDECIAKGWNPSIAGVLRFGIPDLSEPVVLCTCPKCGNEHRKA
jgi:hypothetical protein